MQVTKSIFEEQKPKLLENLRRSIFVAFDLEFSGLQKPKEGEKYVAERPRGRMTLQECYASTREAVETYQLLQVGLCPVEWREEDGEYPFFSAILEVQTNVALKKRMLHHRYVSSSFGYMEWQY